VGDTDIDRIDKDRIDRVSAVCGTSTGPFSGSSWARWTPFSRPEPIIVHTAR